jgi:IS5 family transposase
MLYHSDVMRRVARIDLLSDTVPDETTIGKFRHLLERHQLTTQMLEAVKALFEARQLLLKAGTIVDATISSAPSSTKDATPTRDPEMRQTTKWNPWYFGKQLHVGTDRRGTATRRPTRPTTRCRGSSAAAGTVSTVDRRQDCFETGRSRVESRQRAFPYRTTVPSAIV